MGYKNGKDVLPHELLHELQKYVQGELLYIPKTGKLRARWGENNGTRKALNKRNQEIFRLYTKGTCVPELVKQFHLSEDSIRKIIKTSRELNYV